MLGWLAGIPVATGKVLQRPPLQLCPPVARWLAPKRGDLIDHGHGHPRTIGELVRLEAGAVAPDACMGLAVRSSGRSIATAIARRSPALGSPAVGGRPRSPPIGRVIAGCPAC
jgi:hypothetical protein